MTTEPARRGRARRAWLVLEYLLLFVGVPLAFVARWLPLYVFPALWLIATCVTVYLLRSRTFDRRSLWNAEDAPRRLARAALPLLVGIPAILALTWWLVPERWFGLVRHRTGLWVAIMLLYPILSVVPQGLVYRVFVFHRYRELFPTSAARIAASAVAFSLVHVVFENPVAPALTLVGGLLFAHTYERTRSSLVASFQHALFGCVVFTSGLGVFFYYGAVGR